MNIFKQLHDVTTFILDIDGVMTDGKLYLTPAGEFLRTFSVKDGFAMKVAAARGYQMWICSGGHTAGAEDRFRAFGISEVHMRVKDKTATLQKLQEKHQLSRESMLYLGDDIPDIGAMQMCGLSCCPQDAAAEVKQIASYVSPRNGGEGVVRDVIEMVLKAKGDWPV